MSHPVVAPKKLIEVALPLDSINVASAREKSIRHGHPSTLHLYWARRPLATARAVLFAQLVNDPSWEWEWRHPGEMPPSNLKASWARSRQRLFDIIEDLVVWKNSNNPAVIERARTEIAKSWRETCEANADHPDAATLFDLASPPAFLDPFAGGGSIPLEAQRLGMSAVAADLNPVAVLINKAMIQFPAVFASRSPVNAQSRAEPSLIRREWKGAEGIAEDVRRYGQRVREEAVGRLDHLYPRVEITEAIVRERDELAPLLGQRLPVVGCLWARTVRSPNPAFSHVAVPLVTSFLLSEKAGREVYIQPVLEGGAYRFEVRRGRSADRDVLKQGTTAGKRAAFRCLMSDVPITYEHIRAEGQAGRLGQKLMAVVAEAPRGRVYLSPTDEIERAGLDAVPTWEPALPLPANPRDFKTPNYGITRFADLFTRRQLLALDTFSDLISESVEWVRRDAVEAGMPDDGVDLHGGGTGATAYAQAVSVYLAFALSKLADYSTMLCRWFP